MILNNQSKHIAPYIFFGITLVLILASFVYLYQWRNLSGNPIRSDGWGYYSYLPAVFDYNDLSFSFSDDPANDCIRTEEDGSVINKYPIGTAVMESPFFLLVDILLKLSDSLMATGYTEPYQCAIMISTTFYFVVGLLILYKYLKRRFSEKIVMWTLISITFATNLFHYATFDASFSHIYSFFLITAFVYTVEIKELHSQTIGWDLLIGFLGGMVFITRNPNIIIVFYYLFLGVEDKESLTRRMKEVFAPNRLMFNAVGAIVPIVIQCVYWFYSTGHIIIRSYDEIETFSWLFPHVVNVLFSVTKGMLFYAPVLGLAFIGFFVMKKSKSSKTPVFISTITVIILEIYITSCWDNWQYGGSYGQRPFVDFYCLFALLIAYSFAGFDSLYFELGHKNSSKSYVSVFDVILKPVLCLMILVATRFMLAYWHGILPFKDATMENIMNVFNWNFDEMRMIISGKIGDIAQIFTSM